MSALADSIVPQMSLLDLPVELIREILLHTYGRDHGFQGGAERAIFRTRIAIEGTCRFLRYISARLPWTMSCGIVDFDSFGTLSMAGLVDRERRNDASELFFVTVPERLRTFPGINVTSLLPIDVAARWLERFYESKFGVEQSADPTADPLSPVVVKRLSCDCHVSFLPVLHRPWRLSCLEAHYGGRDGAMSPNELVGVVGNLAPSLKQFSLSFDEAFDEANNVESVIVGCLAALRTSSKGIEGISLRRDSDRRVSGITTIRWEDIEPFAATLEYLSLQDIFLGPGAARVFPKLDELEVGYWKMQSPGHQACFSSSLPAPVGGLPPPPSFPNLELITFRGIDSVFFEQLVYHCPKLRRISIFMEKKDLRALHDLCTESDSVLQTLIEPGRLEYIYIQAVSMKDNERLGFSVLSDCVFLALKIQDQSANRCHLHFEFDGIPMTEYVPNTFAQLIEDDELGEEEDDEDDDEGEAEDEGEDGSTESSDGVQDSDSDVSDAEE